MSKDIYGKIETEEISLSNDQELKDAEITLESIDDEKLPFGIVEEIPERSDEDVSNKDK